MKSFKGRRPISSKISVHRRQSQP